jgi:hypothetical protein
MRVDSLCRKSRQTKQKLEGKAMERERVGGKVGKTAA